MTDSHGGKLRGAIIGCGFFSRVHIEGWRRIPDVEIVAACDVMPERAASMGPRAYASAEHMLACERLDFVDIATRPESHLSLLRLAAALRVAVICQKPMAPSWEDALAMVEIAQAMGTPLMIHDNWRWQPWYRAAKEMINRGDIGHPIGYWFRTRHRDGIGSEPYPQQSYFREIRRLLIDEVLVHHIDTARYLFADISGVYAQARTVNPTIIGEDQAMLILSHESGVQGTIDGNRFLNPNPDGPALGESGFEGEDAMLHVSASGDLFREGECVWRNQIREGYRGDSVRATQEHFIACLRRGDHFETGGREYLRTFAAVEAAYRSNAERRAIPLQEINPCLAG